MRDCLGSSWFLTASTLLIMAGPSLRTVASDESAQLKVVDRWETVFPDEEIPVAVEIKGAKITDGRLVWAHSANNRTLSRGEIQLQGGGETAGSGVIQLRSPPLRDEVNLTTTLSGEFYPKDARTAAVAFQHTLTLLPRDALAGRQEWSKQLDIQLFDPVGKTVAAFESLKLPFRKITNSAVLDDPGQTGILIVGEGTSLIKNRSLPESLFRAASNGRRILLLAPLDGDFPFPGTSPTVENRVPAELRFARSEIIAELDKRLDDLEWRNSGGAVPAVGLSIRSDRNRIQMITENGPDSWPWMVARYPEGRGMLVICGFRIVEHWEHGPTPRYLLLKILESLDRNGSDDKLTSHGDR